MIRWLGPAVEEMRIRWTEDGRVHSAAIDAGSRLENPDLTVVSRETALGPGRHLIVELSPKRPFSLLSAVLRLRPTAQDVMGVIPNGYQSWTRTEEVGRNDRIRGLPFFLRGSLGPYGEDPIRRARPQRGRYRGWTWCSLRHRDGTITLVGSTNESFAYTIATYDFRTGLLEVEKDVDGLTITHTSEPFRLYIGHGEERQIWDQYASLWDCRPGGRLRLSGWTSWYYHYTAVTEEIARHNLEAVRATGLRLDVFQIDDGYQAGLGDWLTPNAKFPSGMKALATAIRGAGFHPGLWLAPFICDRSSRLWDQHPEWLLRKPGGHPVVAGWNPGWNGNFYALDLYATGFQDHLRHVLRTILDDWGYDLVKLDFLYAVALWGRPDRSRGAIMTEAVRFLREAVGERWILGCGVPLGPALGCVELCRIGSDVAPRWRYRGLERLGYREHPSTRNSLASTVGRWALNRRFFASDPDVFLLRDHRNNLTLDERHTLHLLNYVLGDALLFSDDVSQYTPEQLHQVRCMFPLHAPEVRSVSEQDGLVCVDVLAAGSAYLLLANLEERSAVLPLPRAAFAVETGPLAAGATASLRPHQSVCFRLVDIEARLPYLLGSNGHLLPGADIAGMEPEDGGLRVRWHEEACVDSVFYLLVDEGTRTLQVNGGAQQLPPKRSALGWWATLARNKGV